MIKEKSFSKLGVVVNIFLFVIKFYFGLISGSLALLSDALNSFTDILASFGIHLAVLEGRKKKDLDHSYGHHAAEPISAFVVAILAAVLSFELLRTAIEDMLFPKELSIDILVIGVVLISIFVKSILYVYFKKVEKKNKGQAIKAYILDSKNDVIVSSVVLIGVIGSYLGYVLLDDLTAIIISVYIFKNAFELGKRNLDFLMGRSPGEKTLKRIENLAQKVKNVKDVRNVKAHYFGDTLHVGLTITVTKKMSVIKAHDVGELVRKKIEKVEKISNVSVHVEPEL